MTQVCVSLTQFSVIRIIYRNVCLKCFFHLLKCLLLWLIFYIYILQGSVETRLHYGGINTNNHINANCLQNVPVKKFKNWSIISDDMDKSKVPRFYGLRCTLITTTTTTVVVIVAVLVEYGNANQRVDNFICV